MSSIDRRELVTVLNNQRDQHDARKRKTNIVVKLNDESVAIRTIEEIIHLVGQMPDAPKE